MNYIVGLCGTHGTGKSTIVQGVKALGYHVNESQLSRAAQKELGWESLSIAQESEHNMWLLQEAILGAMYDRDTEIAKTKNVTLVERTPADVWAYTVMWCNRLNINPLSNRQAISYKRRCYMMAEKYAKFIEIKIAEQIPFVKEANRADLESRQFVSDEIAKFLIDLPHITIASIGKDSRIAEAATVMTLVNMEK